jgi:prepilin-type processing-associated H-X9-DG protein
MGNWVTEIASFLEESTLFDQFDFENVHLSQSPNRELARTAIVQSFICPSDELANNPILENRRPDIGNPPIAQGLWYPGCMGPTIPDRCEFVPNNDPIIYRQTCLGCGYGTTWSRSPETRDCNRAWVPNSGADPCAGMICRSHVGVPFRKVTDGLSQTIMAGETLPAHYTWNCLFCRNFPVVSTHIPINLMETDIGLPSGSGFHWRIAGYKSMHPGGINVVMGDGSVTFLNETTDYVVYNMMGSKSQGDIPDQ